jgi:hypothetical protein
MLHIAQVKAFSVATICVTHAIGLNVGTEKRREKVVVLRELQRAIIYTRELSKQAIEGHVSTVFIVSWVNEGARLTLNIGIKRK